MPISNQILYPPILPDTYPTFLRNNSCKIYFALSEYISEDDIKNLNVHISLINHDKNISALKYASGIKNTTLNYESREDNYNYYVEITQNDLKNKPFGLNQYYKIQLRFSSILNSSVSPSVSWLEANSGSFSEWSKPALIKGISQPKITLRGFEQDTKEGQELILSNSFKEIIGKLSYADSAESEYLRSYNIKIYQTDNLSDVLFDSGEIYSSIYNPNQFKYNLSYNLMDGVYYTMKLTYTTNNLYVDSLNYNFIVLERYDPEDLNVNIFTSLNLESGNIKVQIKSKTGKNFIGNFTIRRASSKDNFNIWEDIKNITYTKNTALDYTWYDNTVQSGVWYKYGVQKRESNGNRGLLIKTDKQIMCQLDDMYLTTGTSQLKIQFNPTVSDFKYNISESQQITIGAKYPYIKRNGDNYFRTFSIGGLISSFLDTSDWYDPHFYDGVFHYDENELKNFTSKEEIHHNLSELYQGYNQLNNITESNDFIYERLFREKVYDFLYKNDIKLFRSTTEGNILIKLMNISFQPMESLGRRLYSFTATAVEVDEANLSNYNKYKINILGNYSANITLQSEVFGILQGTFNSGSGNLIKTIQNKYSKTAAAGYKNEVKYLKQLKIQIESQPYIIVEDDEEGLIKANEDTVLTDGKIALGYIAIINGVQMIIPSTIERRANNMDLQPSSIEIFYNGFFELKGQNIKITDLQFKYPTEVLINYIAKLETKKATERTIEKYYYYYKIGQLYDNFQPNQYLAKKIFNKYLLNFKDYYQELVGIEGIRVEGPPGAVIYVKDSKDGNYFNRHVLENGYLQLRDDETSIKEFYFAGIHLKENKNPDAIFETNRMKLEDLNRDNFKKPNGRPYKDISEIEEPKNGYVYLLSTLGFDGNNPYLGNNGFYNIICSNTTTDQDHWYQTRQINENEKAYILILKEIEEDKTVQLVYYYNNWYILPKIEEISSKLLKGDIRQVRYDEYTKSNSNFDSFDAIDIENLIDNCVYTIDNVTYIYYHKKWYPFKEDTHDVLCPVDGIVDYFCEVVRGDYKKV